MDIILTLDYRGLGFAGNRERRNPQAYAATRELSLPETIAWLQQFDSDPRRVCAAEAPTSH
jgi:hypothetical protein